MSLRDAMTHISKVDAVTQANRNLNTLNRYVNETNTLIDKTTRERSAFISSYEKNKAEADRILHGTQLYVPSELKAFSEAWEQYDSEVKRGLQAYSANLQSLRDALKAYGLNRADINAYLKKVKTYKEGFVPYVQHKDVEKFRESSLKTITGVSGTLRLPTVEEYRKRGGKTDVSVSGVKAPPPDPRSIRDPVFSGVHTPKVQAYMDAVAIKGKLEKLEKKGLVKLVTIDGNKAYELTKPVQVLTNQEMSLVRGAGFNVGEDLKSSLSWNLYQWGEDVFSKGNDWKTKSVTDRTLVDFAKAETEYYSAILGTGAQALAGPYRWLQKMITGEDIAPQKVVTVRNLKYLEDLTPKQQSILYVGGAGANYLGTYVAMLPVGMAASGIVSSVTSIGKGIGVSSPAALSKITSAITSRPQLTKAFLWAPIVGMEATTVWKMHESGVSDADILGEMAMRAGTIIGGTQGFATGYREFTKIMNMDINLGLKRYKLQQYMNKVSRGTVPRTTARQELVPPGQTPGPTTPFLDTSRILSDHTKMTNYHASRTRAMLALDAYTPSTLEELKKLKGIPLELWMMAHFPSTWVKKDAFESISIDEFSAYLASERGLSKEQIDAIMASISSEDLRNIGVLDPVMLAEGDLSRVGSVPTLDAELEQLLSIDTKIDFDTDLEQVLDLEQETPVPIPTPTLEEEDTPPPPPEPPKFDEPTKPDETPPITPPVPKKKGDPGSRPNVFRALIGGMKEKYRVVFNYRKGKDESFTVTARSFPQALSQATQLRRVKYVPSEVDVAKVGK